jgi:hypothetical protein
LVPGQLHRRLAMNDLFTHLWNFVCNVAGLVFLLWLLGQVIKGMFKGGR